MCDRVWGGSGFCAAMKYICHTPGLKQKEKMHVQGQARALNLIWGSLRWSQVEAVLSTHKYKHIHTSSRTHHSCTLNLVLLNTYTHIHAHTRIHRHTNTSSPVCAQLGSSTLSHTYTHTYKHTKIDTNSYTQTYTHTYTHIPMHTHTHTNSCTHTYTHKCTHTVTNKHNSPPDQAAHTYTHIHTQK